MGASVLRDRFGFGVPSVNVGKTTLLEDDQNIFALPTLERPAADRSVGSDNPNTPEAPRQRRFRRLM